MSDFEYYDDPDPEVVYQAMERSFGTRNHEECERRFHVIQEWRSETGGESEQ